MPPSDRFKPIHQLASQKERKAAVELGESIKQRDSAQLRLAELEQYHKEYLERFAGAARNGLNSNQIVEYQVFIGKLEDAIAEQRRIVQRVEQACLQTRQQWQGRYTKAKAMENAIDRMRLAERRQDDRREQAESDDLSQRKR
ncbi:MAG: flagellar export protein FliJ [Chromatiaceae bacterium]|jgi:flagellar FliJ protein